MNWSHMGWGGGYGMIFFWIILVIVVIVLVKMLMTKTYEKTDSGGETPLEILKRRYANGEINREEYEEKKIDLQS